MTPVPNPDRFGGNGWELVTITINKRCSREAADRDSAGVRAGRATLTPPAD
jgi:hypothetical protein